MKTRRIIRSETRQFLRDPVVAETKIEIYTNVTELGLLENNLHVYVYLHLEPVHTLLVR